MRRSFSSAFLSTSVVRGFGLAVVARWLFVRSFVSSFVRQFAPSPPLYTARTSLSGHHSLFNLPDGRNTRRELDNLPHLDGVFSLFFSFPFLLFLRVSAWVVGR